MITLNNVSGGKSSAYMAVHYPTDYYLFACVRTFDQSTRIEDKSLRDYCQDKLPFHDWDFSGSRELDQTLQALRDLEQIIGKEIKWVASNLTYDELLAERNALPNCRSRFCTAELKIQPSVEWIYSHLYNDEPIYEQLGFRADEGRSIPCSLVDIPTSCSLRGSRRQKWIRGLDLRNISTPMVHDGITIKEVMQWVNSTGLSFPLVSNCDGCFFHTKDQLIYQSVNHPQRMKWWLSPQRVYGRSFYGQGKLEQKGCFCND